MSSIEELPLKWTHELLRLWWCSVSGCLLQRAPIHFRLASGILKESPTAVGRRIPCLPLPPGLSSSPLHPTQLVPNGTMLPAQMATWQQSIKCLHRTSGFAAREQGNSLTWHTHAHPCLYISRHGFVAISCLVVVFTCQALWDVLQNSRPVHTFHRGDGDLWRGSSASNELLPSNFSSPVALHPFTSGMYATGSQSCSRAEVEGRASRWTVVTRMWGEQRRHCLHSAFVGDWLGSLMARHHHLPSRRASNPSLRLCKCRLGSRGRICVELMSSLPVWSVRLWWYWRHR